MKKLLCTLSILLVSSNLCAFPLTVNTPQGQFHVEVVSHPIAEASGPSNNVYTVEDLLKHLYPENYNNYLVVLGGMRLSPATILNQVTDGHTNSIRIINKPTTNQ